MKNSKKIVRTIAAGILASTVMALLFAAIKNGKGGKACCKENPKTTGE